MLPGRGLSPLVRHPNSMWDLPPETQPDMRRTQVTWTGRALACLEWMRLTTASLGLTPFLHALLDQTLLLRPSPAQPCDWQRPLDAL